MSDPFHPSHTIPSSQLTLLLHSCAPTTHEYLIGETMMVRAASSLKSGARLSRNYLGMQVRYGRHELGRHLLGMRLLDQFAGASRKNPVSCEGLPVRGVSSRPSTQYPRPSHLSPRGEPCWSKSLVRGSAAGAPRRGRGESSDRRRRCRVRVRYGPTAVRGLGGGARRQQCGGGGGVSGSDQGAWV